MKLAVVGWATDSGVGRELVDAIRNLPVAAAFLLENPSKPNRLDLVTVPYFLSKGQGLHHQEMEKFIDTHKPSTVLTWEVPGSWAFPDIWARKGVKWVHMVHWDWFAPTYSYVWKKARLLSPNVMCQRELKAKHGLDSTLLPVPVDTERLAFRERKRADLFISVYGYGGQNERRSISQIFEAWHLMPMPPKLVILAQKKPDEIPLLRAHPRIDVELGNAPEPADLYKLGDIAVQPSRYEGVGVSMVEAQACGLPVIAIDAPPMNEVVMPDLLVKAAKTVSISIMGKSLVSYVPSVDSLKAVVERIQKTDITDLSHKARRWAEDRFSWKVLRRRWIEALS